MQKKFRKEWGPPIRSHVTRNVGVVFVLSVVFDLVLLLPAAGVPPSSFFIAIVANFWISGASNDVTDANDVFRHARVP